MDFLGTLKHRYELPPPGRYQVRMIPEGRAPFRNRQTAGLALTVKIVGGDEDGRDVRLRFLTEGPGTLTSIVARDVRLLVTWTEALGIPPVDSPAALLTALGREGSRRIIHMTFAHWTGRQGESAISVTGIEVDSVTGKSNGAADDHHLKGEVSS